MTAWSEDMIELCADLMREKWSASQIGGELGISRNAVIGKVHRDPYLRSIGFVRSSSQRYLPGEDREANEARPRAPRKPKVVEMMPTPETVAPVKAKRVFIGRPLSMLGSCRCRYAVNDARPGETHLFCGEVTGGGSWCDYHRAKVYGTGTESERSAHRALIAA